MDMGQAIRACLRQYITFSGRASRAEYWWWVLFTIVVGIAATIIDFTLGMNELQPVNTLFSLFVLLPSLAVLWRRMHDIGLPGYYGFINLVGILLLAVGVVFEMMLLIIAGGALTIGLTILLVYWLARRGDAGVNSYGPPPVRGV